MLESSRKEDSPEATKPAMNTALQTSAKEPEETKMPESSPVA